MPEVTYCSFLPPFPALEEELAKSQKELSGSREKAAILMEMCKQNNARIEELLTENSKLKSRLTAIEETSKTYDVREEIHTYRWTHLHMQTPIFI